MRGLSEINMHQDALELAKQILAEEQLDAISFNAALSAILVGSDDLKKLSDLVQAAYHHLPKMDQQKARHQMLGYFCSINDMKSAMNFASNPNNGAELFMAMDVCLANDRLDEAEKLFFRGKNKMQGAMSDFNWSMLFTAMAHYCERTGNLDEAERYWLQASELDEPLLQEALTGLVKIQIVRAWKQLQQGLGQIEKFKPNINTTTALTLPGNHDILLADARKELEAYREALEKIVPGKDMWRFGIKI